jgi:hypothetical protein
MAPADRDLVVIVLGAGTSACYALERGAVRCIVWLDADVPKSSVEYRREKSSAGFVVETNAHERHWLHHSQATLQTPAKKLRIACRYEETRSPESRRGAPVQLIRAYRLNTELVHVWHSEQ